MTTGTKESELVMAVLLYAIRCLAEGDQHALRGMNFGPEEVAALRELNLADLYRAGSLQAHCLAIRLNRAVYWPMLAHLRQARESEAVQRDLIQADAPLEMMLTVDPSTGRPAEPDEATSHAVWQAWSKRVKEDPSASLTPEDYLALGEDTGASLRAVWNLIQRWTEYGDLSHEGVPPETDK